MRGAFFAMLLYAGLNTYFVSAAGMLVVSYILLTNQIGGYVLLLVVLLIFYSIAKLKQKLSRS